MTDTVYTVQFLTFGYILYVEEDSSLTQLASGIKFKVSNACAHLLE